MPPSSAASLVSSVFEVKQHRDAENHAHAGRGPGRQQDRDFGRERLAAILDAVGDASASEIADRILAAVEEFSGDATVFDDQTLIVLRVL